MTEFKVPSDAVPKPPPQATPMEAGLESWAYELWWQATSSTKRTLQKTIGPSEAGYPCDRQLSYKLHAQPPCNLRGVPMSATAGTALHGWIETRMEELYGNTGRYKLETPVTYRGMNGTCDVLDRLHSRIVDWKSTSKTRLNQLRKKRKLPTEWRTQTNLYAAGMVEAGYPVKEIAVVAFVREGNDFECIAFVEPYDQQIADDAIDRVEALRDVEPQDATAVPSILCQYCPFYKPDSADLTVGCPGKK